MKVIIGLICCLFLGLTSYAQDSYIDSLGVERDKISKTSLHVLGAWAGLNIIQSSISLVNAQDDSKYFFRTNIYWNGINAAIAGVGLLQLRKQSQKTLTLQQQLHKQNQIEKVLLFNTGLNMAYITTGLYLKERANNRTNADQLKGTGNSLILQGCFLLALDGVQYFLQRKNGRLMQQHFQGLELIPTANGVGLVYRL